MIRKIAGAGKFAAVADQKFTVEIKEFRIALHLLLPPFFEGDRRVNLGRELAVVEFKQIVVAHQNVLAARLVLLIQDLADQFLVFYEELFPAVKISLHQCMSDEQFPAQLRIFV